MNVSGRVSIARPTSARRFTMWSGTRRGVGMLVILVVFCFSAGARGRPSFPSVAVPVSLISTFGVMYLCGYSLDNLSLMALTIATGFVVDDAIVVLENISRHLEQGFRRSQAALRGAREISFTVLSMSLSLVAVSSPFCSWVACWGAFSANLR